MPGIFGGVAVPLGCYEFLTREFQRRWGTCETYQQESSFIGGHAFAGASAVFPAGRIFVGVDGERSLYRMAAEALPDQPNQLFQMRAAGIEVAVDATGNIAVVEPETRTVYLAADWTGTFPLYYAEHAGGFLFSSLMRPLATTVAADIDPLGALEFLRQAYTAMGKTLFKGVKRLMPGQSLRFTPEKGVQVFELSEAWVGNADTSPGEAANETWQRLRASVQSSTTTAHRSVLMMSAGWDSRTLMAAFRDSGAPNLSCYSHGDTQGRELRIVERICRMEGTPLQLESISDSVLALEPLQRAFERTENVVFPHWHRAGRLLSDAGADCITAGIYGEVMGGHYGPAMVADGTRKILTIAGPLLGLDSSRIGTSGNAQAARDHLRVKSLGKTWYLDQDFERSIHDRQERLNAEIDRSIARLERRGVTDPLKIIEAFITEHRATHYIAAQLLSCRAHTDVALPFGRREMLGFASRLPLPIKVHNRLSRAMLGRYAPTLLRPPLAATLAPASAPIIVQEASRFARKVYEQGRYQLHIRTRGRVQPARLGWVNFDFLRTGSALRGVIEDLKSDLWNRHALERQILALESGDLTIYPHPLYDQIMKIYTVDLMLR